MSLVLHQNTGIKGDGKPSPTLVEDNFSLEMVGQDQNMVAGLLKDSSTVQLHDSVNRQCETQQGK